MAVPPSFAELYSFGLRIAGKSGNTVDAESHSDHGFHLVHGRTTNAILSGAYRVHSRLGPGLLERPYRVCVCYELTKMGIAWQAECPLPVRYEDVELDIGYRIDLLVEKEVIVEVKSVEKILPVHEAQLLSYLRLSGKRVGLLINFNVAHLKDGIRRKINGY